MPGPLRTGTGRGATALVAKITSKDHGERPGVIPLPAGAVGDQRGRRSFLETDELREVRVGRSGAGSEWWTRGCGSGCGVGAG